MTGQSPADLLQVVPEAARVRSKVSGELVHLCPHVDEVDEGHATISWDCLGSTVELHSLRKYLDAFDESMVSSEWITEKIRSDIAALAGIGDVEVTTYWNTAGMDFTVSSPQ